MTPRQAQVLGDLLDDVRARKGALVVFDLDDTLFATAQRHLRILREYAAKRAEAAQLAALRPEQLLYSITETAKAHGFDDAALLEELRDFRSARFFKNEYLLEDRPVAGAALYCREVLSAGGKVVYLTGRDEAMRSGTLSALSGHAFPIPDDDSVVLILKPRFDTPDVQFKAEALKRLAAMGHVAGSFENEPAHINLFQAAFPKARHIFLDTRHSGKPVTPHPAIPWIKDFRRG